RLTFLCLMMLAAGSPSAFAQDSAYRVLGRIPIGGEGGWDYLVVDAASNRLFVSHATHVVVVDLKTDSVVGDIPNTLGVHGIALVPGAGRGFTSNGRDSTLTIFDYKTLAPIGTVAGTGRNPDAIMYDSASNRV